MTCLLLNIPCWVISGGGETGERRKVRSGKQRTRPSGVTGYSQDKVQPSRALKEKANGESGYA